MNCKKCQRPVHDCPSCNGGRATGMFGKLTCSKCNNTGLVCSAHGGNWAGAFDYEQLRQFHFDSPLQLFAFATFCDTTSAPREAAFSPVSALASVVERPILSP